jgi:hypothetical protein
MSATHWVEAYLSPSALVLAFFLLAMAIELSIGRLLASRRRRAEEKPAATSYWVAPLRQRQPERSSLEQVSGRS